MNLVVKASLRSIFLSSHATVISPVLNHGSQYIPLAPREDIADSESYIVFENTSIHLLGLLLTWQQLTMTWIWNGRRFVGGRVECHPAVEVRSGYSLPFLSKLDSTSCNRHPSAFSTSP